MSRERAQASPYLSSQSDEGNNFCDFSILKTADAKEVGVWRLIATDFMATADSKMQLLALEKDLGKEFRGSSCSVPCSEENTRRVILIALELLLFLFLVLVLCY